VQDDAFADFERARGHKEPGASERPPGRATAMTIACRTSAKVPTCVRTRGVSALLLPTQSIDRCQR
jgi:hypothetical protein